MFARGKNIWIVFNDKLKLNYNDFAKQMPSFITNINMIDSDKNTIMQLTSDLPIYSHASKAENSNDWLVNISRRKRVTLNPIRTKTVTNTRLKPHLLVEIFEAAESIELSDPDAKDKLIIIPLYQSDRGVYPARKFVDFKLLKTSTGIAVVAYNDNVETSKEQNGIRISVAENTIFSGDIPKLDLTNIIDKAKYTNTLFPDQEWQADKNLGFAKQKQQLEAKIISSDHKQSILLRMRLVQLYMSSGLYHEAIGMLNIIRGKDKQIYDDYQLSALKGAANFMVNRFAEAEADFFNKTLRGEKEIKLWRNILASVSGKKASDISFIEFYNSYAKHYPKNMKRRLAIIAADQKIAEAKPNDTLKIIDKMSAEGVFSDQDDYVDYMTGRSHISNKELGKAVKTLETLINRTNDRFIYTHANFALAAAVFNEGEMVRKDFIERLERTRLLWRGDSLELSILQVLGEIYTADKQYLKALRAWKDVVTYYPFTLAASETAARMADIFQELFNNGKADGMSPLDALALYYEFRELTPIGKDGDLMVQNLASRLAQVDLLSRAAALLEHQVKHRLEGEERSKFGATLALLYILNKQPEKALETLKITGYGSNDEQLENKRQLLTARAYADIGENEIAINLLEDNFTVKAKQLKLDIYWEDKDWINLIPAAEDILASRKNLTAPLTDSEAQTLLRLGIAYTFENDALQLQYLRDYFTPLLAGSPIKNSFLFITNDKGIIDHENFKNISNDINNISDYIKDYKNLIKSDGLNSIFE